MKPRYALKGALTGAVLGLGAPVGYILYSAIWMNSSHLGFSEWCFYVFEHQRPLLAYLTFPTVAAFSCFGYYHGRQENRLDFKTQQMNHFLNVAVHDIRAPLTVIKEASQLIKDKLAGPITDKQEEFLEIIGRQGNTMHELITEILDIHKMESGQFELAFRPVKIVDLTQKAAAEMKLIVKKKSGRIKVISDIKETTEVYLDAFRIRQVIRNIIGNAVKYMPEGSAITVRIFKNQKDQIEIAISNEGEHIPEEKIAKIFDKFSQSRTRDYRLGHGLGLSICKNIMDLHHGKIWAENLDPVGACFHITFSGKPYSA